MPSVPRPLPTAPAALLCVALAACAARAPGPAETPAPAPRAPAGATPAPAAPTATGATGATSWRFAWSTEAQAFAVHTEADVERTGTGGAAERERVESSARVTIATLPAGGGGTRAVAGRVDSLRVRASARVSGGADAPLAAPVSVRGSIGARGAVRLDVDGTAALGGCTTPAGASAMTALAIARETLPRIPAALTIGARWRDTVATVSCAGPLPVAVQAIAAYEVEGQDGALLRVRRRANSTLRGQGFAGGQSVRVAGSGTADATLLLDPARGTLHGVTGEGRTTMTMTIGTTTHGFEQRTRVRVERP